MQRATSSFNDTDLHLSEVWVDSLIMKLRAGNFVTMEKNSSVWRKIFDFFLCQRNITSLSARNSHRDHRGR